MSYIDNFRDSFERGVSNFCIEALTSYVKPLFISEALERTGCFSRRVRKLPAELVIWFIVAAGLFKEYSISNLLGCFGMPEGGAPIWERAPSSTAFSRARQRLGVEPLLVLGEKMGEYLRAIFDKEIRYRGLALMEMDGLTLKVADSPANRDYFGAPGQSRGKTAYPQMRAVLIGSVTQHFVLHGALCAWTVGEVTLALRLIERIEKGTLLLMDRNFAVYEILCALRGRGCEFIVRARKNVKMERIEKLGEGEWLSRIRMPRNKKGLGLPETIIVREIERTLPNNKVLRLTTSLSDAAQWSADEISALYAQRWEAELMHDEIKTHQCKTSTVNRPVICRSKTPTRAIQEAMGIIIAYNATRAIMAEAARKAGISPLRISFTGAHERVRQATLTMLTARTTLLRWLYSTMIAHIGDMRLPPRRSRSNPRVVRVKFSAYPVKRKKITAA